MQSHQIKPMPRWRHGGLRMPPWRYRVGLGGRDKSRGGGPYNQRWLLRTSILLSVFAISTLMYATSNRNTGVNVEQNTDGFHSRHLLSATPSENATSHGPAWETCDYESSNLPGLWVTFYAVMIIIFFISLAIICDDFFVPSLEAISERLELSEDVAGATFMAAGSSTPELFTSVVGVAYESDVGVGTIVGSAVFNILIIIALTAALAGQILHLDWRPLTRDSIFYAISIACFIGFSWDAYITIWEAAILVALYIVYIILMKFNPKIMEKTEGMTCGGFCDNKVAPSDPEAGDQTAEAQVTTVTNNNDGQEAMNGNGPPRKLPPIEAKNITDSDRKISVLSNQSLTVPPGGNKHIFHHIKHGELSSNFTSSNYDLKKLVRDSEARSVTSSRPNSSLSKNFVNSSRPASEASNINNSRTSVHNNGVISDNIPMTKQSNGGVNHHVGNNNNDAFTPTTGMNGTPKMKDDLIVGDVESLGGDSQGEYGSQSQLLGVPNTQFDNDSGIHSAQGPTPVMPESSSDPDPSSDSKRRMSLVDGLHHTHHSHHHHQADHADAAPKTDDNGQSVDESKEEEEEQEPTLRPCCCLPAINMYYPDKEVLQDTCGCVRYAIKWVLFVFSFPFMCAFTWTIPNCSLPHLKKYYVLSFMISVLWIAVISFAMVTLVIRTGCILNVDDYTMGLVIVAIGTSVPDALSSILVGRDGYGDMAVSNAIGSNVFDINLGLGLPFILRIAFSGLEPVALLSEADMERYLAGDFGPMTPHAKFGFILLLILLLTIITFTAVRFRLNSIVGIIFASMYVIFLIYAFIQELVCHNTC